MTFTVSLTPDQEARLLADAQAKGVPPENVLQEIVDQALPNQRRRIRSAKGILAHLGPSPSFEDIKEIRREMWRNFPRDFDE